MMKNIPQGVRRRRHKHKEKKFVPFLIPCVTFITKSSFKFGIQTLFFLVCLSLQNLNAQLYFKTPESELRVENESKEDLGFPWAGGMNSCQFGEIDMNLDGTNDLFVFDRHGNRIMTFLNSGTPGTVDYDYAPEYIHFFPELNDWAILADYNADGKPDIFTLSHNLPGIVVYRNTSLTELEFSLEIYPYLTSYQGGGYVNILVTNVDYPGISDIDNDGDLDILTFWGLGSFVDLHVNQSMEKYGIPDSLDYIKTSSCWGRFAENDESNEIYLDTCIGEGWIAEKRDRHTGSTFLLIDLDSDLDKDLILGDVDYPNLVQLTNGGTPQSAVISDFDTLFPSYDKPVNLFSMPVASFIDVNNDQVNDLILSPFDPSLVISQNFKSVWLYVNEGGNSLPDFNFETNNFLQQDMIDVGSGAYPVMADYNNDGLTDLFISNYGDYIYSYYNAGNFLHSVYWSKVSLFENTGTVNQPQFRRVTHNFMNIEQYQLLGTYLAFGDLDGDLDGDLLLGHSEGNLWYFENTAGAGNDMFFDVPVQSFQGIDVGAFSTPCLFDLDSDGLVDLIIGEENGNLNYYRNSGSATNAVFSLVTDSLGKVNVTDYSLSYTGYSTPCFFKNQQGETNLLVGSEEGKLFYFINIEGNLGGKFEENDSLFSLINDQPFDLLNGIRTSAVISDLNNDGFLDLIEGNFSGGLNFYYGLDQPPVIGQPEMANYKDFSFDVFPNPSHSEIEFRFSGLSPSDEVEIHIFHAVDGLVFSEDYRFPNTLRISVEMLPCGVYICQADVINKSSTPAAKRIVIVK